ncbi:MAG: nucleotide sugar dehydrogenase [Lentisphaeria bacterium]|nr:nucleotide sugar dehydrogenase [Lentisphaeria bacterium]
MEKITGNLRIAVIGMGYVGLPLAIEFGKKYATVGFDIKAQRLEKLRAGIDVTCETAPEDLAAAGMLKFSGDEKDLAGCDVFIVTVPTPVDKYNRPDLTPLYRASESVGRAIKPGAVVVYESTVYPGCTEEECVPVLEKVSGLKFNKDFFCGYSPERINPGDKKHSLLNTVKITSGSTPEAAAFVDELYNSILTAGTHPASSIKVAEAAKVIENSQRDINIAFVNELAKIFHLIGIDTAEVLAAAGTKWNFLNFRPGLVGGHCIGVDPYYLTHKAQSLGYHPEVILAGRRINDEMGKYAATEIVKMMIKKGLTVLDAKILQLGITFKENCPDCRNSRAVDVVQNLQEFGCQVDIFDPWAAKEDIEKEYGLSAFSRVEELDGKKYDVIVLTVAHREFMSLDLKKLRQEKSIVFDIKSVLPRDEVDARL